MFITHHVSFKSAVDTGIEWLKKLGESKGRVVDHTSSEYKTVDCNNECEIRDVLYLMVESLDFQGGRTIVDTDGEWVTVGGRKGLTYEAAEEYFKYSKSHGWDKLKQCVHEPRSGVTTICFHHYCGRDVTDPLDIVVMFIKMNMYYDLMEQLFFKITSRIGRGLVAPMVAVESFMP